MTILPFPDRSEAERAAEREWLAQLDDALAGGRQDAEARQWRQLAEDVRTLPPAIGEDFELRLQQRVDEWRGAAASRTPLRRLVQSFSRPFEMGTLISAAAAIVVALVLVAPWRSSTRSPAGSVTTSSGAARHGAASSGAATHAGEGKGQASAAAPTAKAKAAPAFSESSSEATEAPAASGLKAAEGAQLDSNAPASRSLPSTERSPGALAPFSTFSNAHRVQQVAASITLATPSGEVQSVSGGVSRVTREAHGFVQSSHVEVDRAHLSEAHLTLRIPSAKLGQALGALEALAPVKDKSQSLQDITGSFDAAKQRLSDADAHRQALLRALGKAYTEAEVESLHGRLSLASREVAQASAALHIVERRGRISTVHVTILGSAHSSGAGGLTIDRGLHDAGEALTIALVVLLVALSILLPVALLLAALTLAHRAWRRRLRERSLDAA